MILINNVIFRKNPSHKRQFAHPGDDDYVPPMDIDDDSDMEESDKPECEFGVNCFRKNPQHKKAYKHTRFPQPRRQAALKGSAAFISIFFVRIIMCNQSYDLDNKCISISLLI